MQCYTELTPPTAVTHSLSLPFVSADSNNLVVAKTSLLQIFTTKAISVELESSENDHKSTKPSNALGRKFGEEEGLDGPLRLQRASRTKLVLVAEYTLSGTVTSLVRIKIKNSKSGGEALLVSFKDAKLSLVEWDPERPGISTISIHYYEQDELKDSPWTTNLGDCVNYLTVDPGSRCAALKFSTRSLAILPFKQSDEDVNMDEGWDEELDGPRPTAPKVTNGISDKAETPYGSSFVLRLPLLDPRLIYPIHLAFLYEYREPTFGILSSTVSPSSSLLYERKDHLSYMVFTLDIEQKESTTILSVGNLPYDLFKIIPLPTPIGGALLVGGNELIHIDQAGKANGVGVNSFAKQCTSFGLADQSDLEMRLEGCTIQQLSIENGEMLIILHSGALAIVSFRLDGRSVSGVNVRRVATEAGGSIIAAGPSSANQVGPSAFFIGSENADSVILGWSRKSGQLSRRKSKIDLVDAMDGEDLEDEDEDEDDDDLYGDGPSTKKATINGAASTANSKAGDYSFQVHDSLVNIAPMTDMTFGNSAFYQTSEEKANAEGVTSDLELVGIAGRDKAGSLAVIHRNIQPKVIGRFEFPEARGIWTMSAKRPTPKALQIKDENDPLSGNVGVEAQYDRLMIVSKAQTDAAEESDVYALTSAGFEALTGTEFEPAAGSTIEAGTLGNGNRVVQVLKSEVRSYDGGKSQIFINTFCYIFCGRRITTKKWASLITKFSWEYVFAFGGAIWERIMSCSINESTLPSICIILYATQRVFCVRIFLEWIANGYVDLGLAQILPMYDEDTGAEPKIISASFADPFLLLLRDDSSIFVAQCDDNNELEEIEREDDGLLATKWLTGCLYADSTGVFTNVMFGKGEKAGANVMMFLLSAGGALHVSSIRERNKKQMLIRPDLCIAQPFESRLHCGGSMLRAARPFSRLCCQKVGSSRNPH
jgi:cleavage and polyadenylation specificity factor subunit 1